MELTLLIPLFLITALLYSMVGFGGGSTYLALLALFGVSYTYIPSTALICNIIVVSGGCYFFIKEKHFKLKYVLPFLITSMPLAYLGGSLEINKNTFFLLLALSLLIASARMFLSDNKFKREQNVSTKAIWGFGLPIGALLGFLSGVTGIGGGIFLAPVLYLLGWTKAKTVAASASFFILVNSLAGLSGQFYKNSFTIDWELILPLAIAVFIGGQIGSRLSAKNLSLTLLKRLTASLVLFVSLRIFWQVFS